MVQRQRDSTSGPPRVALIIESSLASGRRILEGISRYVREHGPWSLCFTPRNVDTAVPRWLRRWKGDGLIARVQDQRIADALQRTGLPVVDTLGRVANCGFPLVHVDNAAIGGLAADHLLERGFANFGCCAVDKVNWSEQREAVFVDTIGARGYACPTHCLVDYLLPEHSWEREQDQLARWIARLPKPVALFAVNDDVGMRVLDACQRAALPVPDKVAVVGVDNDEVLCAVGDPALSSVAAEHVRVGYEAAAVLANLMRGGRAQEKPLLIAPSGVVIRASSDVLAIDDPMVADALRVIRQRACQGIRVGDVAEQICASRSTLKRRFKGLLNRSIHDEILAVQLQRVRSLLAETELPLKQIAKRSGFRHMTYMSVVFKKVVGMTPGQYRQQHQNGRKA